RIRVWEFTLVECSGELKILDWTFVWSNELNVLGTHAYSKKATLQRKEISTMELLLQLIQEKPEYPLEKLITHEFSLEAYEEAIIANMEREKYKSIKTLFRI